jgi:phospholipid/cholesterol/gamma-HCH transport system substrate-binding protein
MTKNPLFKEFLTGVLAIAAIAGLCVLLVLFGETANILERHYRFTVHLAHSAGLGETSPVTLNGVKVGQVKRSRVRAAPAVGVELVVEIKRSVQIPRVARVGVDKGFVGDASLEFIVDPGTPPERLAEAIKEGEVFDGGAPLTMVDRITNTIEKPLQRLTATAESIERLAGTYTEVGERIKEMLEPRTPADVDAGKQPNLRSTLARLDSALVGAEAWLNDEALRTRARDLLARAEQVMNDVGELSRRWQATAEKVDVAVAQVGSASRDVRAQVERVAGEAAAMLSRAQDAAAALTEALTAATRGPGTVGQLMQNPDLYNSLRSTSDRLDKVLVELQLLIEKYKAEGVPIKL